MALASAKWLPSPPLRSLLPGRDNQLVVPPWSTAGRSFGAYGRRPCPRLAGRRPVSYSHQGRCNSDRVILYSGPAAQVAKTRDAVRGLTECGHTAAAVDKLVLIILEGALECLVRLRRDIDTPKTEYACSHGRRTSYSQNSTSGIMHTLVRNSPKTIVD